MTEHSSQFVQRQSLKEAIAELASGARVEVDGDRHWLSYRLVRPLGQPDGDDFQVLIHRGWVQSTANGGGYKISEAGKIAYLKSCDELGNGTLIHPQGWEN